MSRQIKFRGYVKDISKFGDDVVPHKGHFVFGNLIHGKVFSYIVGGMAEANDEYAVLEYWQPVGNENVDEFTGLKDKDGKDIYEGDIVQYGNEEDMKFGVTFKYGIFYACNTLGSEFMVDTFLGSLAIGNRLKVIGNAHSNPELLEAAK